jgi:hypothetical protein
VGNMSRAIAGRRTTPRQRRLPQCLVAQAAFHNKYSLPIGFVSCWHYVSMFPSIVTSRQLCPIFEIVRKPATVESVHPFYVT